jgi:hypothetical protein
MLMELNEAVSVVQPTAHLLKSFTLLVAWERQMQQILRLPMLNVETSEGKALSVLDWLPKGK